METCDLVFVYGTLMQGYGNHDLLSTSEFIGERTTEDTFILVDAIAFPYMLDVSGYDQYQKRVHGELYRMETSTVLQSLDYLESEGSHYHRRLIQTTEGETAWSYLVFDTPLSTVYLADTNNKGEYQWSQS